MCDNCMAYREPKFEGISIMKKKWIQEALGPESKGKLHKALHVKQGEKIPQSKLKAHEHAKGKLGKEVRLAETLAKLRKKK